MRKWTLLAMLSMACLITGLLLFALYTFDTDETATSLFREWAPYLVIAEALVALGVVAWRQRRHLSQKVLQVRRSIRHARRKARRKILLIFARLERASKIALNALAVLGSTLLWWIASAYFPLLVGVPVGMFLGVMSLLATLLLIPPLMERLMIRPNRNRPADADLHPRPYEVSRQGFFTDLQQGRVKVLITQHGSLIRMLMDYDGRRFDGEDPTNDLRSDQEGYWKVVPSGDLPDSHPIPFPAPKGAGESLLWWIWVLYSPASFIWWAWKREIYLVNGAVWVGIPGYRTLRMYPLDRYVAQVAPDQNGVEKRMLVRKLDISDHYRVADFQLGVRVPDADSQNLIEVKVDFNQVGRVTNPFLVTFNTDDQWPMRFTGAGANAITSFTRSHPVEELIGAQDLATADAMSEYITQTMTARLQVVGIEVSESQYIDISPTNPADASRLGAKARAKIDRDAAFLLAEGNAAPIREAGKALEDFPAAAHIPALEAQVRTAQVAGDRAFILLGNMQGTNPLEAAMLQELRRLNALPAPVPAPAGVGP